MTAKNEATASSDGVRWDLSDLYSGPDDERIDADLDRAFTQAKDVLHLHVGSTEFNADPEVHIIEHLQAGGRLG